MSNDKEEKEEIEKPESGWESEPNTHYITKSKDGKKHLDKIKKHRLEK